MKNIKFDRYFKGDWTFSYDDGVGLKLTGFPSNEQAFLDILQDESCNPVAARRILASLKKEGVRYTTVMSYLNFNFIGDELKKVGVRMEIVAPGGKRNTAHIDGYAFDLFKKNQGPVFQYLSDLEKNSHLSKTEKNEVLHHYEEFKKNIELFKSDFGPYHLDRQKSEEAHQRIQNKIKN